VLALTGIDTDTLPEEKKRGLTIENGYAFLTLPDGRIASVIDAPGHEKFVRRMLAGSGSIDAALLVVAADDGPMPQTREHLDILKLLKIPSAVVALSKCDLVSEKSWLELVSEEIKALTKGVFSNDPKIIEVSAKTGQGIEKLKEALFDALSKTPPKPSGQFFRLPLDRLFSKPGFGTVAAGTLLGGPVKLGDTVWIYPSQIPARVRQIEVHNQIVDVAYPGQRTALNLVGVKKQELHRGDVLASPSSLKPSFMLDAFLTILPNSPFTVKSSNLVKLHLAAKETTAKVVLMSRDELSAGQSDYVQFRLKEPVTARRGDRLVIRLASPRATLGGGEVLDPLPQKHRRHKLEVINQYQTKEKGAISERVELVLSERPGSFATLTQLLLRADLGVEARQAAQTLEENGVIVNLGKDIFIHQNELSKLTQKLVTLLENFHLKSPREPGASSEEIRSRLAPAAPPSAMDELCKILEKISLIKRSQGLISLFDFKPEVDREKNQYIDLIYKAYRDFGWSPAAASAVHPAQEAALTLVRKEAFDSLVREGKLIRLDDIYYMSKENYELALEVFKGLSLEAPVTLGAFRDALNCSRKVAVALLESFENRALAVKSGAGRIAKT
jgi:selenocysteine-specific elongation factor